MADTNNLRNRTVKPSSKEADTNKIPSTTGSKARISIVDIIRILFTVTAATLAVSYYITSGESLTYGYKPWFFNVAEIQSYIKGPIQLTPAELSFYNGADPKKPIYIAINGTIFDVSGSPHMYGPGGGYSVFAGRDATRAFVTGCFMEDRTPDLRGAEEMFIPIDDDKTEEISPADKKARALQERKEAKKKVLSEVAKWVDFYENSSKYQTIGKVIGQQKQKGPPPALCAQALKGRPKRSAMNASARQAAEQAAE